MKFIAHRGASVEAQENTVEAIRLGATLGAYACECDVCTTKDGHFVLFHDGDIARLTGYPDLVKDLTEQELRTKLVEKGFALTCLADITADDLHGAYLLCDLNEELVYNDDLFRMLANAPYKVICGIHRPEEARMASKYFPPEQILAFLPDVKLAKEFYDNGAGIIRLWEAWTTHTPPEAIKAICPKAQVFIMSCNPETGYDGSTETIAHFEGLNADGVLLNNIRLGIDYKNKK